MATDAARDYHEFLATKRITAPLGGIEVAPDDLHPALFPFQRDLTRWALRKGRAALFADTGLGKTLMQLVWAQHAADRALILAPLAVARQTVQEGERWGIPVTYVRQQLQCPAQGISITNYEMLAHFDPAAFGAVVLDESSILKSFEGKTRTALIEAFAQTPLRLCATATPAPNDVAEIANHAEFLGILSRREMLSAFFVHDDVGWRLKGHARVPFYRWLASWGMSLKRPSDLGYSDDGYLLPELSIEPVIVPTDYAPEDRLFAAGLKGITDRVAVRRQTLEDRVAAAAALINATVGEPWLAWCGLNEEGRALARMVPGSLLIEGSHAPDEKARALHDFADGRVRVLVTKPSIAGFGMNFQRCARMVFVGMGDSYEQYYQAIRRCWRFGQTRPVRAHIVISEPETAIYDNVLAKEQEAEDMAAELVQHVAEFERAEIVSAGRSDWEYETADAQGQDWRLLLGDSVERLADLPAASIDLSVFSPPFQALYTYSPTERDLGNCRDRDQFWTHFRFIIGHLLRVTKPGRHACVHCMELPTTLLTNGIIGLEDFPGQIIEHFTAAGFIYHGKITIDKDPQAQAIRTHSKGLLFAQLRRDASWLRPALADTVLIFRAPGDNAVPVKPEISNDEWIEWARPIWYGIRESDTLNTAVARAEADERHICPLQLGTIERCIRLWSNPGETILSPFAGIGSEGYEAIKHGRRFIGIELKPEYYRVAVRNLQQAEAETRPLDLFAVN